LLWARAASSQAQEPQQPGRLAGQWLGPPIGQADGHRERERERERQLVEREREQAATGQPCLAGMAEEGARKGLSEERGGH